MADASATRTYNKGTVDIFAKVLQGPYAYLLILQVLIVSGLCLTLIYLILLRLRETPAMEASVPLAPAPEVPESANGSLTIVTQAAESAVTTFEATAPPLPSAPPPQTIEAMPMTPIPTDPPPPMETPSATPLPPSIDPQALAAEQERAAALEQEAAMSKDKVRYLESKLLEYEILQEEIGTLSTLKVENEKLRQELMAMKQGAPAAPAPIVAAAEAPPAAPPTDTGPPIEITSNATTKSAADAAVDLLTGTELPTPPLDAAAPVDVAQNPQTESQLDSLMTQIESLTKKE